MNGREQERRNLAPAYGLQVGGGAALEFSCVRPHPGSTGFLNLFHKSAKWAGKGWGNWESETR